MSLEGVEALEQEAVAPSQLSVSIPGADVEPFASLLEEESTGQEGAWLEDEPEADFCNDSGCPASSGDNGTGPPADSFVAASALTDTSSVKMNTQ